MKRVVIFASGQGSTFEYLVQHANQDFQVVGLFCNRPEAGVIDLAKSYQVPWFLIDRDNDWQTKLEDCAPDLIVLAGYLKLLPETISTRYPVINTHPALLPSFGGKGYYGLRVHQAVLEAGERFSGVTIHWVNEEYDRGDIIAQQSVDVLPDDTPEFLAERVQKAEKPLLLHTIIELLEAM